MEHRTLEDVDEMLHMAKLSRKEMLPCHQSIFFHPDSNDDLMLLETDKSIMETVNAGGELLIRGDMNDSVMLCTCDRSYALQEAEISNSLLLVDGLNFPKDKNLPDGHQKRQVLNTFHVYWEAKQCPPRLHKLYNLLNEALYEGRELENKECVERKLYTREDLLNVVQCSRVELDQTLTQFPVVEIDGYIRMLEATYHFRTLDFILKSIDANSFALDKIDAKVVIEEVSELEPRVVVEKLMELYTLPNKNNEQFCSLKKDLVCRFIAEALLQQASKFRLSEFETVWRESVPDGLETDLSMLRGIAIVNNTEHPPCISYLSVWDLPEEPGERFNVLFHRKSEWSNQEIEPYIKDLCVGNVSALLLKYARVFKRDGESLYSRR